MPKIIIDDIDLTLFPLVGEFGITIEKITKGKAILRLPIKQHTLRPGGTISGPAMMAISDFAIFIAIQSLTGKKMDLVTTNLNCNFLRKPKAVDLLAHAEIMKIGSRLAYGTVCLYSEGDSEPVAHVTCTFSIPPK
ncbi:MAG: thioesterase [Candidatus Cloacimonadota bacterium]|nr:MAG: thioesterase [Candidatus Cloacimonadota bacterium]